MAHSYFVVFKIKKHNLDTYILLRKLLKTGSYFRFNSSTWIIESDEDITTVTQRIYKIIRLKGFALVFEVTDSNYWAAVPKKGRQWLVDFLP